ncbi:LPS export ABC transporter periplasmic protein LptC [Campylobacter sp. RM13119]|uniref:LPS export ABC transporter periplasmic protein LptC n=1 Tax=Campylobacter californiensis TaxID=1032243 RepID=A0ABD4JK83_9BACT|nr:MULTISPECIES: LPS export ABC transporter periplasmic protein LptC [unclassified Campylobacter]MBE2986921.1 LPS export ABC transporter periplasmic protein LptC [Campylobacter sp. RM12919]MBE2987791.1 LPS export ABC transporter periplasmic protein LptC [Campylobacter sp. RM12920]MBE3021511.1 LPS export ABC transporter periplasmic protein LptC [Campylobacter sp. 7477a]MBE3605734.1 LPS export ABC transporter periplasmic protein LptC [Campylobacter sp. RM13119]MBE3609799.1 LPS export ABC transpo
MVIKIFYFVVAVFSAVMIFLALQDPYFAEQFKRDMSVSNMQMNDVVNHEINSSIVSGIYEADEVNRYAKKDEFLKFKADIIRGNLNHKMSSDVAISQGNLFIFKGNAKYDNNESLNFISEEILYNLKTKIVASKVDFVMTQNGDKITGNSITYNTNKKQTQIKGLKAWIEQERD